MNKIIHKIAVAFYELAKKNRFSAHVMFGFLEWINEIYRFFYLRKKIPFDIGQTDGKTIIISVAFNNPPLIEKQIALMKKFGEQNIIFVVADNSSSEEKRQKTKKICSETETNYVSLPKNRRKQPSLSHGLALNWCFENIVKKSGAFAFGFIDHDIFPTEKISIVEKMKNCCVYGLKQERNFNGKNIWYLWAGFCFFRMDCAKDAKLNFSSVVLSDWNGYVGLDTGGGNFEFYSKLKFNNAVFARQEYELSGGETMDEWYHIGKSSEKNAEEIREKLLKI